MDSPAPPTGAHTRLDRLNPEPLLRPSIRQTPICSLYFIKSYFLLNATGFAKRCSRLSSCGAVFSIYVNTTENGRFMAERCPGAPLAFALPDKSTTEPHYRVRRRDLYPSRQGCQDQPDAREGQAGRSGVAERFVVPLKPGNAGGGKGPQFKTDAERAKDMEIRKPINST